MVKTRVDKCDMDGYASAAILYNFLYSLYPELFTEDRLHYQVHDDKTHGLTMTEDVLNKKYDLIIVPDAGSNQYEEHKQLAELGIDIIILDHHEAEYESPHAIVVNNQLSPNYSNKTLSGAGIVWQLCKKFDFENDKTGFSVKIADNFLDLVALALIADMSDLRDLETKRLIEKGIEKLNNKDPNNNKFLQYLVDKNSFSLGKTVTPIGLAFYIAPSINAVVRVGTLEERVLAFEAFLEPFSLNKVPSTKRGHKAGDTEVVIEQAARVLTNIKNRQKKTRDEAFVSLEKQINEESLSKNPIILLNTKGVLDKNLNGLVANQVMSKYQRPTFVGAFSKDAETGETLFRGSARGIDSEQISDFRQFIEDSGFCEYATGHARAFGVCFTEDNLNRFLQYASEKIDLNNLEPEYSVDFIFTENELREDTLLKIASLESFWGQGLKEPLIALENVRVDFDKKTLMSADKNPTIKMMINNIGCIKFRASKEEFESIAPNEHISSYLNIVGKCNLNEWNGNISAQILIEDYQIIGKKVNF